MARWTYIGFLEQKASLSKRSVRHESSNINAADVVREEQMQMSRQTRLLLHT